MEVCVGSCEGISGYQGRVKEERDKRVGGWVGGRISLFGLVLGIGINRVGLLMPSGKACEIEYGGL